MALDPEGARRSIARSIAEPLGVTAKRAAWGIHETVNANMVRALRMATVERGRDPREFTLIAFGGAGPIHACRLARESGEIYDAAGILERLPAAHWSLAIAKERPAVAAELAKTAPRRARALLEPLLAPNVPSETEKAARQLANELERGAGEE